MAYQSSYNNAYLRDIEEGLREMPPEWDEITRALHEQGYQYSPDEHNWVPIKSMRESYKQWCKDRNKSPIWVHPQVFGTIVAMAFADCPKTQRRGQRGRTNMIGPGGKRTPDWASGGYSRIKPVLKKSDRDWLAERYGIEIDLESDGTYGIRHVACPDRATAKTESEAVLEGIKMANVIAARREEPPYRSENGNLPGIVAPPD